MRALMAAGLLLVGCAGSGKKILTERKHENIKRDYEVTDASSSVRPGWIEDAVVWAGNHKEDSRFRYFSYETDPMIDRRIACDLAAANSKSHIAGEISTFIHKNLNVSREGSGQMKDRSLEQFIQHSLKEKIQGTIHGSAVYKTYWEKRHYLLKLGAKKEMTGYTCAVLTRIEASSLKTAVEKARQLLVKIPAGSAEKIEKVIEKTKEAFTKKGGAL